MADVFVKKINTQMDLQRRESQTLDEDRKEGQLSVLAVMVTIFRKSGVGCRVERGKRVSSVEIGWPTDVRHVAHVTFDRFNGFLGLPVEFEPQVSKMPPSASTSVFGVSTKSMQLSFDSRGNSVPTILLQMQRRLYDQGGLQVEGIFRINAENTREELVRGQLNAGVVAEGVDMHCLAGLIKAWFRELPTGILDSLTPGDVMQCQSEEEYAQLVKRLPPTEGDLLDWVINLMADVVEMESFNKMNAHNIALVFAPNMTQMADPLTALMYAVHVINFLKSLITKTLRERKQSISTSSIFHKDSPGENDHQSSSINFEGKPNIESKEADGAFDAEEPLTEIFYDTYENIDVPNEEFRHHVYSNEKLCLDHYIPYDSFTSGDPSLNERKGRGLASSCRYKNDFTGNPDSTIVNTKSDKLTGISSLTRIDSKPNRTEAWR